MKWQPLMTRVRAFFNFIGVRIGMVWTWFRARRGWTQVGIAAGLFVLLVGGIILAHSLNTKAEAVSLRTVTLTSVGSLSGTGSSVGIIGTVRSVAQADILAQTGGTVRAVHTQVGASVPAGFIIAELENATERAQVLQAQGYYDAAIAARTSVSPSDVDATVRNAYRSAYASLDTTLTTQIDQFYGEQGAFGPSYIITPGPVSATDLSKHRQQIKDRMDAWRTNLATANSASPAALLDEADQNIQLTSSLLNDIARSANSNNSGATAAQLSALATARATVNSLASSISGAREAYRGKSVSSTASVDASVKQALGSLRLAQANLEKSYVRAPIGGTVNFLPIHVGDYVAAFSRVATVANNGSLEIVAYVSEDNRNLLVVGQKVRVNGAYDGIITSVAPALDPTTKQIEVHVAVAASAAGTDTLVNGQSVTVAIPNALETKPATATPAPAGPTLLPLAAVKLRAADRIVFTVQDGRLVANVVTIGDVRGDRIEITSPLSPDLMIVEDARGLADGEKVNVAQ